MWRVKNTGTYLFDDSKDVNQIEFSFMEEIEEEEAIDNLCEIIYQNFSGMNKVTETDVEKLVLLKTIYPAEGYYKKALRRLEEQGKITNVKKINGKKRNRGTFSHVIITFR